MSNLKFNPTNLVLIAFIVLFASLRVIVPLTPALVPLANFTVVGAIAMFGGAYFKNSIQSFVFPILTLLLSDLMLGWLVYPSDGFLYAGWYYTYLAFALMVLASRIILKKVSVGNFLLGAVVTVFIHWIVTDLGVWYGSAMYPQTLYGYWLCLVAAIPFERSLLYSTMLYGVIMFGGFEYVRSKFPSLKTQAVRA